MYADYSRESNPAWELSTVEFLWCSAWTRCAYFIYFMCREVGSYQKTYFETYIVSLEFDDASPSMSVDLSVCIAPILSFIH